MPHTRIFAAFVVLTFVGMSASAALARPGPCANFEVRSSELDLTYNPFSPAPVNHPFDLQVRRLDPTVTSVQFLLMDQTPANGRSRIGPAGPYGYDLVWRGDTRQPVLYVTNQAINAGNSITTSFGGGANSNVQSLQFLLHIPRGQPVAASEQLEDVELVYQCIRGDVIGPQESQYDNRVSIRLRIPQYFGAYLGAPGRTHGEIDFGTLTGDQSGAEKFASVTAVSTVPYSMHVTTEHGSILRRFDRDAGGIPYTMRFGELPVTDQSTLVCPMTRTAVGDSQQLKVKLDGNHLHDLSAGVYRDTITLTFTPLDAGGETPTCVSVR